MAIAYPTLYIDREDGMSDAPWPVIEVAIEATSARDREKLVTAIRERAATDRSFQFLIDNESGQTIIQGTSELHLDLTIDRLRSTCGIVVKIGAPQVAYRETLTKRVEKDYTYDRRIGGMAQFARVKIVFEPLEPGAGTFFESKVISGAVPPAFVSGVEQGIGSVMGSGVLAGFPLIDIKATLIDGAFRDTSSSVAAFEAAARAAFREALRDGGSVLLEPVMAVEVTTPHDYTGSVRGDLVGRRGRIQSEGIHGDAAIMAAMVPLANLFGYGNQLKLFSEGRATFAMVFAGYELTPTPDGKWPPPAVAAAMRA